MVRSGLQNVSEQNSSEENIIDLFKTPDREVTEAVLDIISEELPHIYIEKEKLANPGQPLLELLLLSGLCPSKGQARKDIGGGGIYVNGKREINPQRFLTSAELLNDRLFLLRKGKKNYVVVTAK